MIVVNTPENLRNQIDSVRSGNNTSIGFVPTMGALHEGHFSLVRASKKENTTTICSIFVNPTQFNNPEDFEKYPNMIDSDIQALEALGCDIAFIPQRNAIYPHEPRLKMNFGTLESTMEGAHRPGHFNGVGIVVSKFFHMVQPDKAYFGQKDLQQFAIVSRLTRDLSFPVELVCCPTVREEDGLAMSSRNLRLSPEGRQHAPVLHQALNTVKEELESGQSILEAKNAGISTITTHGKFKLEYLEVADFETLQPLENGHAKHKLAVCVAAELDNVRLIDNIIVEL